MPIHTLYLCYFSLREPLVQTQVLPYLRQLIIDGIEISLITFEPKSRQRWTEQEFTEEQARLAREGIHWSYLRYHKWPSLPATLYDIWAGARRASRIIKSREVKIIHARSHVAATMGAVAKWMSGGSLIFDIRGFMPEEYVDAGVWSAGSYLYRLTKAMERRLFSAADAFVVLTEQARNILFPGCSDVDPSGRPVAVIPCCVDMDRLRAVEACSKEELRKEMNLTGRRVITYVGALGGWYLTREMAEFLAVAHQQDKSTFSIILTQSEPEIIAAHLGRLGVAEENYSIRSVLPEEVPRYLKAADIALSLIKPCYSKLSSSPTKIAEYLASGLPIICNSGIGDVDKVIENDRVGVIIHEFNREAYLWALYEVENLRRNENIADRCRASADSRFDLEKVGGIRYRQLYRQLLES